MTQNHDLEEEVVFKLIWITQVSKLSAEIELLKKDDKQSLLQENQQLKAENEMIQSGTHCVDTL